MIFPRIMGKSCEFGNCMAGCLFETQQRKFIPRFKASFRPPSSSNDFYPRKSTNYPLQLALNDALLWRLLGTPRFPYNSGETIGNLPMSDKAHFCALTAALYSPFKSIVSSPSESCFPQIRPTPNAIRSKRFPFWRLMCRH